MKNYLSSCRRFLGCGAFAAVMQIALGPSAYADDMQFSVQPRMWYAIQSSSVPVSAVSQRNGAAAQTQTPFNYPFAGVTMGMKGGWLGANGLAITVLHGQSKDNFTAVQADFNNVNNTFSDQGFQKLQRTDIEALFVHPLNSSASASVFLGGRMITFFSLSISNSVDGFPVGSELIVKEAERDYFLETGFGLNTNITDDGKHGLFANMVGLIGRTYNKTDFINQGPAFETRVDQWTGGFDTNVGYNYKFNDQITLLTRYRTFITAPLSNWNGSGNFLIHGPEVGLRNEFK
jgi:hypothetical protein